MTAALALSRSDRRTLARILAQAPKKARPKAVIDPMLSAQPWKVRSVLDPLDTALSDLLTKGLDVMDGHTCFRLTGSVHLSGPAYALAPAIDGILAAVEIAKVRHGWQIDTGPMERVMKRLYADAVLFEHDIHAARKTVGQLYPLLFSLRASEASTLARDAQIKCEITI